MKQVFSINCGQGRSTRSKTFVSLKSCLMTRVGQNKRFFSSLMIGNKKLGQQGYYLLLSYKSF